MTASGKPLKIICTNCGKEAFEAGIAVSKEAIDYNWEGDDDVVFVDGAQPLCEACVNALLGPETRRG